MEDAFSEEELGENQETSSEICGKKIETCKSIETRKQQKIERRKEECEEIVKYMKQYEETITEWIIIQELQEITAIKMKLTTVKIQSEQYKQHTTSSKPEEQWWRRW